MIDKSIFRKNNKEKELNNKEKIILKTTLMI